MERPSVYRAIWEVSSPQKSVVERDASISMGKQVRDKERVQVGGEERFVALRLQNLQCFLNPPALKADFLKQKQKLGA